MTQKITSKGNRRKQINGNFVNIGSADENKKKNNIAAISSSVRS
jgi:hypothetical protein